MKTTYCPDCKKDVNTGWKFGRQWCRICDKPLTEQVKIGLHFEKEAGQYERARKMAQEFSVFDK